MCTEEKVDGDGDGTKKGTTNEDDGETYKGTSEDDDDDVVVVVCSSYIRYDKLLSSSWINPRKSKMWIISANKISF